MSVLGRAVHLLPPSVVIKAPMGKFGLVAMTKAGVSLQNEAIPVASIVELVVSLPQNQASSQRGVRNES